MSARVYASVTGDYPNIGDAVIRREALLWVPRDRQATLYASDAPEIWLKQIGASPHDTTFRKGRLRWLLQLATRRRAIVVFEPGEVALDGKSVLRETAFLITFLAVRARGGAVLLPPRAIVDGHPLTVAVHRLSCRVANLALWRDETSRDLVRAGQVVPDIAFAGSRISGDEAQERNTVVISLRGKRAEPSPDWCRTIQDWAASKGLRLVTAAQVREDEERARVLASRMDAMHLPWAGDDLSHESALRELYGTARIVISDRLHVLIISSLCGSVPAEVVPGPAPKVQRHFTAIGFENVTCDFAKSSQREVVDFLNTQLCRAEELADRLDTAREDLIRVRGQLEADFDSLEL